MLKLLPAMLLCIALIPLCDAQVKDKKQSGKKEQTIFSVGGNAVTTDEFIYLYRKNHQNRPDEFTEAKIDEYLKLFIDFKLKVREAVQRGMDTTAAFKKEYNSYRAELRKPYLPDNSLTDSLVKMTYERMSEELRASHLLVALKPDPTPADTVEAYRKAVVIRDRILATGDFAKEAMQNSDDPSSKTNRGDLGYFTALQMVYPFENTAYAAKVKDVSQPVRTRFGYHLIQVTDRRPSRGEVEVSHIMIRIRSEQDNETARNTIFNVYEQLQGGVAWSEACKQYSEDPATKDQGGKLRPFGAGGMGAVPEFEKAAFELQKVGDVSDPVKTQYGWHIIRLEKKIPLPTLEALSVTLKARVARDERTSLSKQALQEKLRRRFNYNENESAYARIVSLADSSLLKGQWKAPSGTPQQLFSLGEKVITDKDFFAYIKTNSRQQSGAPTKYMEQLYNNFVEFNIMELVEEGIVKETPTYSYLLKEYYEGILLFEIMEKEVWNKASNDSTGQHAFYQANQAKYQTGERAKAVVYEAASREAITALEALVKVGDERKIQEYIIESKGKLEAGYFKKEEKEVFGKINWAKGVYPAENKGIYYLAWIKDILPAGTMSFEEARPAIISDYQADMEKKWLEQLKKKYSVKVNGKGKQHVIQTLQTK
ncbi:MAG: peptidylprolyl isomerase [Chryseolinea sp.]